MPPPPLPAPVPSIVYWNRLEPVPQEESIDVGLRAETADPLWLLARQWQFGELTAQDAASPVDVLVETEAAPFSRAQLGDAAAVVDWAPREVPLEALVEAEPIRDDDAGLAADAALHLIRLLAAAGFSVRARLVELFPFQVPAPAPDAGHLDAAAPDAGVPATGATTDDPGDAATGAAVPAAREVARDPATAHVRWLTAPALPDARSVARELRSAAATLPARLGVEAPRRADALTTMRTWLTWYDALVLEPPGAVTGTAPAAAPAWDPRHLEYRFAVSAVHTEVATTVRSDCYRDGAVDWPDLEASADSGLGGPFGLPPSTGRRQRLLPTPVRFPGMPASRFWEIEDITVSFAGLDPGLTEVGAVMLAEFGLVYGGDWFALPLDVPLGSLLTVNRLTVTDSFGIAVDVDPVPRSTGGRRPWSLAELSVGSGLPERLRDRVRRLLPVPATPRGMLRSAPVEAVELGRDEMANLVWAVERLVTGPGGGPVDRSAEVAAPPADPGPADPRGASAWYQLASPRPAHWVPYVPAPVAGQPPGTTELHRQQPAAEVQSRVARESAVVAEADIPAGGITVERAWRLARWVDGRTVLWMGRRVVDGKGAVASGLVWDRANLTS